MPRITIDVFEDPNETDGINYEVEIDKYDDMTRDEAFQVVVSVLTMVLADGAPDHVMPQFRRPEPEFPDDRCQPIGCDNGYHRPGCKYADIDANE